MQDDTIQDLKQFITATVSGQLTLQLDEVRTDLSDQISWLGAKLSGAIQALDTHLTAKIDDLSQSVAEALHGSDEATDSQLKDHEKRIAHLESAKAT